MTELLTAEFEDHTGVTRTLSREEILGYVGLLAGAGNETTTRLIGWMGTTAGREPRSAAEARRGPQPGPQRGRGAAAATKRRHRCSPATSRSDVEHYGRKIAEGNVMVLLTAAGNRDERHFPEPDRFDIHRDHRPPPVVRLRDPLLPRCRARTSRGPRRARRGAEPVPRMGRRLGPRRAGAHQHRARLGEASRPHALRSVP